ncbi:lipopolysaccharide biosynthesis protein [Knoellia sp. p5-6-4]|uniref:lipopolysaccharide biosynthesis protein n=1 Tax=unclassified Knoellia TaxID=2618719 RepID=UPI0023DBB003|nr:lipopolysaccharide biosynthesis protein [Knoellia sp. p5-6-4]MDF2146609.1 lipopolysaccharide biosynthesis protein [Knoellia sp. p5-6-4]
MTTLLRPVRLDQPTVGTMAERGAWGLLGTASQGGLRFAANLLVGRMGGPVALGIFQSAISVALLLSLCWPTSIGSAAAKFLARSRGGGDAQQTQAVAAHLGRRSVQVTALMVVVCGVLWSIHDPRATVLDVVSIALLLAGYCGYAFTRGVQYGVGQVRRGTQWDVIASVLGLVGMLVLLLLGIRSLALLLPLAASYGVYTVACWPHGARSTLGKELRREIDGFITLAAVGSIVSAGFLQLAMIVAKAVASPHDAGLFAAAMTLATPASLLAGSLSLVLFPTMAESWGRGDRVQFHTQTDLATRGLFSVMVAIFGPLALCSRLIVDVLWGDRYADSAVVLPILMGAVCLTTLGVSSVNAIMTAGRRGMRITTGGGIAGMTLGCLVWLFAGPAWGIVGIAVGYLAGTATIFAISFAVCWRQGGHHWVILTLRTVSAMLVVAGLCVWSAKVGWGSLAQVCTSAAFLVVWGLASLPDLRRALPRRCVKPRAEHGGDGGDGGDGGFR